MFKYLIKTISIILILVSILFFAEFVVTEGLKKNTSNVYVDWNNIYKGKIDGDLIINGSSIAEVQISPKILDTILNTNSYNLGMSGYSFLMQKARYDILIEHNRNPETIIQIVGDRTFTKKEGLFQLKQFLPYLNDSIIRNTTQKYEGISFLDYNVPFVKYSGKLKTILKGLMSFCNIELLASDRQKGFISNDFEWDYEFDEFKKEFPEGKELLISDAIVNSFELFINEEKKKGTEIFIVFPPTYFELFKYMKNRTKVINLYKSISEKYNVTFLDYSNSEFTRNKELFYNATHLNTEGAELFSRKLASDIKTYMAK